jgi:hypothetical protein
MDVFLRGPFKEFAEASTQFRPKRPRQFAGCDDRVVYGYFRLGTFVSCADYSVVNAVCTLSRGGADSAAGGSGLYTFFVTPAEASRIRALGSGSDALGVGGRFEVRAPGYVYLLEAMPPTKLIPLIAHKNPEWFSSLVVPPELSAALAESAAV